MLGTDLAGSLRVRHRVEPWGGGPAVELVALPHLERRVEGHRPSVRIVVVRLRASEVFELRDVLGEVVGDPVRELHLVDGAGRSALPARAVVRDEYDERALELSAPLQVVEQPPDLVVGVREEARIDLYHARK